MKKGLTILLAFVIAMLNSVVVFAEREDVANYWSVGFGGAVGTSGNNYVEVTDSVAHSGESSMHVVYKDEANNANIISIAELIPANISVTFKDLDILDMSLKFYIKGTLPGENSGVTMGLTNGFYAWLNKKQLGTTDNSDHIIFSLGEADANGWQEVEIKLWQALVWHGRGTVGGNMSNPTITIWGPCDFYMDDFSLAFNLKNSDWSGKFHNDEILKTSDVGFENVKLGKIGEAEGGGEEGGGEEGGGEEEPTPGSDEFVEKDYYPANLYLFGTTESLAVSWLNARVSTITGVRFFDITDGEETEITEVKRYDSEEQAPMLLPIPKKAYAPVNFLIEDLTAGEYRKYKIVTSFSDHADTEYVFDSKVAATDRVGIAGWGCEVYSGAIGYSPIVAYIYPWDTHSGSAALKVISNNDGVPNVYLNYMQGVSFSKKKDYLVSFWAKSNYTRGTIRFFNNWSWDHTVSYSNDTGNMSEWVKIQTVFKAPESTTFRMTAESAADYYLIDDIEIYELDENGEPTGDNLAANPGFESGFTTSSIPSPITGLTALDETPEIITLNWPTVEESNNRICIYKKVDGNYIQIASLTNNNTSFDITGLVPDEENVIAVTIMDDKFVESEYKELTVTPRSYPYKISNVRLTKQSKDIEKLQSGVCTVKASVKNNAMGENFSAELIGVLYKDGYVDKIFASTPKTIVQSPAVDEPEEITLSVGIPDDIASGNYSLSVYLWDSYEGMSVLSSHTTFTK